MKCIVIFSTIFVWNISYSKKNSALYHICTCARYSCQILRTPAFSDRFLKIPQTSNFIKIRPVGAELFHGNRQI